jgi:hypothetical protein
MAYCSLLRANKTNDRIERSDKRFREVVINQQSTDGRRKKKVPKKTTSLWKERQRRECRRKKGGAGVTCRALYTLKRDAVSVVIATYLTGLCETHNEIRDEKYAGISVVEISVTGIAVAELSFHFLSTTCGEAPTIQWTHRYNS